MNYFKKLINSPTYMTWFNFVVKFGGFGIVLPLILKKLPVEEVNVWLVFQTIISIILLLDLGINQSFSRVFSYILSGIDQFRVDEKKRIVAEAISKTEKPSINLALLITSLQTSKYLYLRIGVLCLFSLVLLGYFFLSSPISYIQDEHIRNQLWIAYALINIYGPIKLYGNYYASFLSGINKVALVNRLDGYFGFVGLFLNIIILIIAPSILAIITNIMVWNIALVVRNRLLVKGFLSDEGIKEDIKSSKDKEVFNIIYNPAWRTALGLIFGYGIIQLSGLFVSKYIEPIYAASYLLSLRIFYVIIDISKAPFYSKIPYMTILKGKGEIETMLGVAKKGVFISFLLYSIMCISVLIIGDNLLEFIGSETRFVPSQIWIFMIAAGFVERYGAMHIQMYSFSNHIVWHFVNGVSGFIYIVVILIFNNMGLIIFPIAMLMSNLAFNGWYPSYINYKYYDIKRKYELNTVLPVALLFGLCLILIYYNFV